MDGRLLSARNVCASGLVDEAIAIVAEVLDDLDEEHDIVEAVCLVPAPIDPLTRARVHLLTVEAMTRVRAPSLIARLTARLSETSDHFRPAESATPAHMDALAQAGDRPGLLDAIAAFAGDATSALDRSRLHLLLGSQALMDGRFGTAADHVRNAGMLGGPGSDARYLGPVFRFALARRTGDGVEDMVAVVSTVVEKLPHPARGWLALALMAADRRAEALRIWALLADQAGSVPVGAPEFLVATVGYSEVCAWLGDRVTAQVLLDRLAPYSGQHAIASATSPYEGPVDLARGRLSRLLGLTEEAREQLHRAVTQCRAVHAPVHEAITLVELARNEHRGTRAQSECAAAAREIVEQLGLRPLSAILDDLEAGSVSGPLTPRESEIVAIATTGATNAEIARRLFLSERTVENHLSRAMRKAGVTSRTALAAWHGHRQ